MKPEHKVALKILSLIVVGMISLGADAGNNVGFSTYLRAEIPLSCTDNKAEVKEDIFKKTCDCVPLGDRFARPSMEAQKSAVKKGDVFVLVLKRVWMGNFRPDFISMRSQYALISRAFQFAQGDMLGGLDYTPESHKSGRVIYFSDDVRPGQFLNFGQIVVGGPTTYEGHPVAISLYAVEIDSNNENSGVNALISTLASIGTTINPVASPVLSVLESIGTSLVRSNVDDLHLRYDTVALGYQGLRGNLSSSFLAYGDYILFRKENRKGEFDYNRIRYKPSDGKLYDDISCMKPWEGESDGDAYAVIQINKQELASASSYQDYEVLKKAIEDAKNLKKIEMEEFSRKLGRVIIEGRNYHSILRSIVAVEEAVEKNKKPTSGQEATLKSRLKKIENAISLSSRSDDGKGSEDYLDDRQLNIILARLRGLAVDDADEIERETFKADNVFAILQKSWSALPAE